MCEVPSAKNLSQNDPLTDAHFALTGRSERNRSSRLLRSNHASDTRQHAHAPVFGLLQPPRGHVRGHQRADFTAEGTPDVLGIQYISK